MLRYVAIGAIVGFGVAYFLLSAPVPDPVAAEAPPAGQVIPTIQPGQAPIPLNLPRGIGRLPVRGPQPLQPAANDAG